MNKKYTPTTEDVRKRYVSTRDEMWSNKGVRAFRMEFNRWLVEHDAKIAEKAIAKYEEGLRKFQEALRLEEEN